MRCGWGCSFGAKDEPSNYGGGGDKQRREAHGQARIPAAVGAAFRAVAGLGSVAHGVGLAG